MLNFVRLVGQLDQKFFPVFCDKRVFRIVLDILLLTCPDKFKILFQCLDGSKWLSVRNTVLESLTAVEN